MIICLISEEFPPETDWGGIATVTYNQALGLSKIGHRVIVICRTLLTDYSYSIPHTKITIYRVNLNFSNRYINYLYFRFPFGLLRSLLYKKLPEFCQTLEWNLATWRQYNILKSKYIFDVIQTPEYHLGGLFINKSIFVYLMGGKKLTSDLNHDHGLDISFTSLLEKIYLLRHKHRLIANSESERILITNQLHLDVNIPVVYPHIYPTKFIQNQPPINIPTNFLLYVGRLEKRKGVDILLTSYIRLLKKYPSLKIIFIGRDTKTFMLNNQVVNFTAILNHQVSAKSKSITVIYHLPNAQLKTFYQKSLFCVFPSLYEPFGLTCLEAMAYGKAVIAGKNGGPSEIITNKYDGLLVSPQISKLTHKMDLLISDSQLRHKLGHNAQLTIANKFQPLVKIRELERLYLTCLYP